MIKIAVIGSGIAGLTAAHYLSSRYRVHLFEANDYIGGHTHTVDVTVKTVPCAVDTGFIVFNDRTYPNFMRLLDELAVPFQKTEMSFSVRNDAIGLEYNGHTFDTLFAQRRNLVSPSFLRMLMDVVRFNRQVKKHLRPDLADPRGLPGCPPVRVPVPGQLSVSHGVGHLVHGAG